MDNFMCKSDRIFISLFTFYTLLFYYLLFIHFTVENYLICRSIVCMTFKLGKARK